MTMNPFLTTTLLLLGFTLLGYALVLRLGRTPAARSWTHSSERQVGNAIMLLPGAGLGLVAGAAMSQWAGRSPVLDAVLALAFMGFLTLSLYAGLQLRVPLWLLPRWSRESVARRREARR